MTDTMPRNSTVSVRNDVFHSGVSLNDQEKNFRLEQGQYEYIFTIKCSFHGNETIHLPTISLETKTAIYAIDKWLDSLQQNIIST